MADWRLVTVARLGTVDAGSNFTAGRFPLGSSTVSTMFTNASTTSFSSVLDVFTQTPHAPTIWFHLPLA